jgi:hypothetical protein
MKTNLQQVSGVCLIAGTVMTVVTMVLHPSGGDPGHIFKIRNVLIFSHSIAILSLPFLLFGFYGLTVSLKTKSRLSVLGLILMAFGLVGAMLAATLNGITFPLFLSASEQDNPDLVRIVRHYAWAFANPMAYIFIFMSSMAVFIWSLVMFRRRDALRWPGVFGIVFLALTIIAHTAGLNMVSLGNFRVFMAGIVIWNILSGILLVKEEGSVMS